MKPPKGPATPPHTGNPIKRIVFFTYVLLLDGTEETSTWSMRGHYDYQSYHWWCFVCGYLQYMVFFA